jgi:hypothetical protein
LIEVGAGPREFNWGERFVRDDPKNIVAFRHSCGAKLRLEMRCAACGEVVAPGDVTGGLSDVASGAPALSPDSEVDRMLVESGLYEQIQGGMADFDVQL